MPPGRNKSHHRQQQQGNSSTNSTPTNTMTRNIGPVSGSDKGGGGGPPHTKGGGSRGRRPGGWPDSYLADDENFPSFQAQLAGMGLQLRDIPADGNCLFRALGDQLEGHCRNHFRHRAEVVNYMRMHRTDFEPFVEDDVSFDQHVSNLQKLGTHAGNDAIVAFAKVNSLEIIIHQLNQKPFMISGPNVSCSDTRQLHLAYHNGDHYSSVRRLGDNTESPAQIHLQETTQGSLNRSQDYKGVVSAKRGLEDIETEVAVAAGCEDKARIQQSLIECDYDVDAAIAFLLQQMEMSGEAGEGGQDDSTSLTSQQTSTDSGVFNSLPASSCVSSTNSSPTSSSSRHAGIMLRNSSTGSSADGEWGHGESVNGGKGLKVHFREDSFGGNSSGYGSMSSNKGGGARPKVMAMPQQQQVKLSGKKLKEMKKLEKKRKQEEKRREKVLGINNNNNIYNQQYYIPQGADVRDVTVVPLHEGRMARI